MNINVDTYLLADITRFPSHNQWNLFFRSDEFNLTSYDYHIHDILDHEKY